MDPAINPGKPPQQAAPVNATGLAMGLSLILSLTPGVRLAAAETTGPGDTVAGSDGGRISDVLCSLEPYEPLYFAWSPQHPLTNGGAAGSNAKMQLSFAFPIWHLGIPTARDSRSDGLYVSYTQTSYWNLHAISTPFIDTSYKPELWAHLGFVPRMGLDRLGLEGGFAHESNGRDGADSRSISKVFLRTIARMPLASDWYLMCNPRVSAYQDDPDNPDMSTYRGYFDLTAAIGKADGIKIACEGRVGRSGRYGSLQTDVSYSLHHWVANAHGYLYIQSFIGYSETLLAYRDRSPQPRILIGYALVR